MAKNIDDILNPKDPLDEFIFKQLSAGKKEGQALTMPDIVSKANLPKVGEGGLLTAAALGIAISERLPELVAKERVMTQNSEGQTYYWLPDPS